MQRASLMIAGLMTALVLGAAACGSNTSTGTAGGSTSTATSTSSSSSEDSSGGNAVDVAGESSVKMSAENFEFSPATLEGSGGQELTITLENEGSVPHNFSIDDEHIDVTLQPGQEKAIQVTFPKSGSVEFYCSFHQSSGMVGELEVA
jgi:plastocyanin